MMSLLNIVRARRVAQSLRARHLRRARRRSSSMKMSMPATAHPQKRPSKVLLKTINLVRVKRMKVKNPTKRVLKCALTR